MGSGSAPDQLHELLAVCDWNFTKICMLHIVLEILVVELFDFKRNLRAEGLKFFYILNYALHVFCWALEAKFIEMFGEDELYFF